MKRIFVLALAILVCAAGFGQDKDVDMSKYKDVKAEKMVREDLPENAAQMLKDTGIYKM